MTTQTTLLPPTESARLATIRAYLAEQCERRAKAADAAIAKSHEADDMLATFDAAMVARPQIITATLETMDGPPAEGECIGGFVELPSERLPNRLSDPTYEPPATVNDTGTVFVSGPAVEPFAVPVGSRTRYSALVFAYCGEAGIGGEDVDVGEWQISCDYLGGFPVDGTTVIPAKAYGSSYTIERVTP